MKGIKGMKDKQNLIKVKDVTIIVIIDEVDPLLFIVLVAIVEGFPDFILHF